MGFVGADISDLRELAAVLRRSAEKLESDVVGTISVGVRGNPWAGPDAQHFREMWTRQTSRQIRSVASQLREAADVLNRNADEQDSASASSEGGASSTGSPRPGSAASGDGGGRRDDGPSDYDHLKEALRFSGAGADWMEEALTTLGPTGMLSLLDALGEVGGAANASALIPTLSALKGIDFLHKTISSWKIYGGLDAGLGAVDIGIDGFQMVRDFLDDSVPLGTRIGDTMTLAGGIAQQWPPTTPIYWAGTLAKGSAFIGEQFAEAMAGGPLPEGASFWDGVAGKTVSKDPGVATAEVLTGAGEVLADSLIKTFGAFF